MATTNGSVRTKRRAARPASGQLRKQARDVGNDIQAMAGTARDAAQEKLGQLRGDASEYYEQGLDKVHDVGHTLEQFIRKQPLKCVLIAAGVGLLFGRFWMRR